MDQSTFRAASAKLTEKGRRIATSRYDEAAFGSWSIELSKPRQRIVWDGKEQTFAVQFKPFLREWKDRWVSTANDTTLDAAFDRLRDA